MSSKEAIISQYPAAEVITERYNLDQANFDLQKAKHIDRHAEGGAIGLVWLGDEIVLTRRTGLHPGWALIGGTVEQGEAFDSAFVREVKEESGLDITINRLALLEHKIFISPIGENFDMDLAVFEAHAKPGQNYSQTQNAVAEGLEIKSFPPDNLPPEMIMKDRQKIDRVIGKL